MPGGIPTGLPSAQVELTTVLPSEYADPSLREVDSTTVCGQRLVAVCASPNHPATSTGVPPYAKVFIVAIRGSKPEVIATAVCTGDVLSESIVALSDGKCGLVIGAVTRQYGGSVSRFHLREYRYAVKTHQLQRQLVVRYVDGATLPLPGKSGRSPAFLVAEPVYDVFKFQPQRYRFRLYAAPSSEGYSLRLTLMTNRRYDRLEGAYREIRPRLLKAVGSAYSVASLFPPLTPA
jgi:hypothetical protein